MQKIHLTTVNKKTIIPVTLTVIQTFATWLIPSMYGHQVSTTIQHTFTNQVILILFVFMFNFLIFDRFTNKMPIPIFLGMTGISILVVAFSFSSIAPTIGLLLFTCLLSLLPFLFSAKNNWAGWLLFTISSMFILPETFFYVQCGFLSTNFLKILIIPLLSALFFFYPFFIKEISHSGIFNLILGILCVGLTVLGNLNTYTLIAGLLVLISWGYQQFAKQPKLLLTVNVILCLFFNVLILMK